MTGQRKVLEVTTSPRSTWLWARGASAAGEVRALLDEHSQFWRAATRYGQDVPHVVDVEIGVTALEACELLAADGWQFRWHQDQEPLNRRESLFGLPIGHPE